MKASFLDHLKSRRHISFRRSYCTENNLQDLPKRWTTDIQKEFFDGLAAEWNLKKPEDWYHITVKRVVDKGGSFLHSLYNDSLVQGTNEEETFYRKLQSRG
jgi:hypothetical protein